VTEKLYYTTEEVALMFGLTPDYLRRLRSRQAGPVYSRIGGRMIRYRKADVEQWIETATVEVRPKRAS
jgi:predicted DNA-binding transcriptional regulator AlpA